MRLTTFKNVHGDETPKSHEVQHLKKRREDEDPILPRNVQKDMRITYLSKRQEATKPLKMCMGTKTRDDVGSYVPRKDMRIIHLKKRREDFPTSNNVTVGSGGDGLDRAKTFISVITASRVPVLVRWAAC